MRERALKAHRQGLSHEIRDHGGEADISQRNRKAKSEEEQLPVEANWQRDGSSWLWHSPEGEFVIVHGRFSGMGLPVNWIAADILRIENGILVEHWDIIQDEATQDQSKSKAPMFGSAFPIYSETERTIG